jgi:formyl-CoA transferase
MLEDRVKAGFARPGAPSVATNPYYNIYKTRSGHMVIGCLNNRLRRAAARILGVEDARLEMNEWDSTLLGPEAAAQLNQQITDTFQTRTTEEWLPLFEEAGVPCGPVRLTEELYDDPQVQALNLMVEFDHPIVGKIKSIGSPIRMSRNETTAKAPSPALGQQTREVLGELGYSSDEIEALIKARVVKVQ